jgi:hypothetical protein
MQRRYLELTELKHVLRETSDFFQEVTKPQPSTSSPPKNEGSEKSKSACICIDMYFTNTPR